MENISIAPLLDVEELKEEISEIIQSKIKKQESVFRKELLNVIDTKVNDKDFASKKELKEFIDNRIEKQESFFLENFIDAVPDNLDIENIKDSANTKFVHISKNFIDLRNETQKELLKIKCQLDMYFQDQEEKNNLILNRVKVSNSKTDDIITSTLKEMKNRVPNLIPLEKQLDKMMTCISDLQRNQLCYEQKLSDFSHTLVKIQDTSKDILNLYCKLDKEKTIKNTSDVNIVSVPLEVKKVKEVIKESETKKKAKKKEQIKNKKKKVIVKNKEELDEWNSNFTYTTKKYEDEKPVKKEDKISKFGILIYKLKGILKHDKQKNNNNKS